MRRALPLIALAIACGDRADLDEPRSAPVATTPHKRELLELFAFEERRRGELDIARLPPSDDQLGPDPYRIARLRAGRWVGLLRGASAVVLLDDEGVELARAAAPRTPSGLAVAPSGDVFVVGDGDRGLARYRTDGDRLARTGAIDVGALGLRDVALSPDARTAYVVEEREGRLLEVALGTRAIRERGRCHGPLRVAAVAGYIATSCLLDHAIELRRDDRVIRIRHDGPIWSFALHARADGGLLVAAGGVEDHPLVREDGGFGYIDSYVYLYEVAPGGAAATRLATVDVSSLGAVTPKWIAIRARGDAIEVRTAGYATAGLLTLVWRELVPGIALPPPVAVRADLPPGTASAELLDDGTLVAANPLLDAWIVAGRVVSIPTASRSVASRLGEALFFTTAMAPWSSTEGRLSRFTCETCHHEGYVDGRVHFTGRGRVHATTRPLYGLFNNRPYFSRALDASLTQMVHSEFKVANRHNGRDPWFALARDELPWLAHLGVPERLSPELLREALMTFLIDFTHRTNPAAIERDRFTELERAGARVFLERCATCHAARLVADDAATLVPFERWEELVRSPAGPIVWSNAAYARTGVEPYVHAEGARVPSLRRLYKKWPYFTAGSATSLADVLDRFAGPAHHDAAPAGAPRLPPADRRALLAFLELL